MASSSLLEMNVDRAVRQPVGGLVLLALYVQYTRPGKIPQTPAGLIIERLQEIRLDAIGAVELTDEQFRVGQDRKR